MSIRTSLAVTLTGALAVSAIGVCLAATTELQPGKTFTYQRTIVATRTPTVREKIVVEIDKISDSGYLATVTYDRPGRPLITRAVRADATGWTNIDGAEKPHDLLGVDPATLCPLPANLVLGSRWSCDVAQVQPLWPAGHVSVVAVAVTGDSMTLEATGIGPAVDETEIDDDTGQPVHTRTTSSWKTVASFNNGILREERTNIRAELHVGDQTLPITMSVHIIRE